MNTADSLVITQVAAYCDFRRAPFRDAYDVCMNSFRAAGVEPTHFGIMAPDVSSGWQPIDSFRDREATWKFDALQSMELSTTTGREEYPGSRAPQYWCVGRKNCKCIASRPHAFDPAGVVGTQFREFASRFSPKYGYLFHMPMSKDPVSYAMSCGIHEMVPTRTREYCMTVSWWTYALKEEKSLRSGLLRDVFPESYLSEPYLNARLGLSSTTLREWIQAAPSSRGTLEPYTDELMKWTPPVERIPEIREELYRAGRIHYWRFLCPSHAPLYEPPYPEPLYRPDLAAPWEAPDPIPEIYQADFYKDKDPSLTL